VTWTQAPARQLGYATAYSFLLTECSPKPGMTDQTRISSGAGWWALPGGYVPKLTKIGKSSEKVFAADAGKFSNGSNTPTYNLQAGPNPNSPGRNSGPYADYGPFTKATAAYDRTVANGGSGVDGRVYSFRHGKRQQGLKMGVYRLNAVFFDGHCEQMDDGVTTDPRFWLPSGSVIPDNSKIWADVQAKFNLTFPYRVP